MIYPILPYTSSRTILDLMVELLRDGPCRRCNDDLFLVVSVVSRGAGAGCARGGPGDVSIKQPESIIHAAMGWQTLYALRPRETRVSSTFLPGRPLKSYPCVPVTIHAVKIDAFTTTDFDARHDWDG